MFTSRLCSTVVVAALSCTLIACGNDPEPSGSAGSADTGTDFDAGGATGADGAASDATSADSTTGAATQKWWQCSTWESAAGTKTPRAKGCEATFDDGNYGCKAPWYGIKHGGTAYTCNRCRGGDPKTQGKWRAIEFDSEDPAKAMPNGRKELLIVDGNTWHLRTGKKGKDGKWIEAKVDGWYWCADGAELKTEDNAFHVTSVSGSKELGWFAPDLFTGHFFSSGPDLRAWGIFAGFNKDWIGDTKYCRVGSTLKGKACSDPFE
ncbi:MAG: hypothetical protein KC502_19860 [Myxococcales bacterium]|nr:hypothetical protein [Myxococcales bacterium]